MTTEADPPPSYGGGVRQDSPFAVRNYRHPGTGEEAVLSVRMHYPSGQARFFVKVTGPAGRSNVRGMLWGASVVHREQARQEWAERGGSCARRGTSGCRSSPIHRDRPGRALRRG